MGKILGLGRGKTNANYALTGYDYLKDNELVNQSQDVGSQALTTFASALGLGPPGASAATFDAIRNSPAYQAQIQGGSDAITSQRAAVGKLNSGATLKELTRYGQGVADQNIGSFLDRIGGLSSQGQQAATAVGAAGSTGGSAAASSQPQNKGILGRFFGI